MSNRRVYELAEDLGFNRQELVTKINGLNLGISVNNHMSVLTADEVESITRALEKENDEPKVDQRIAQTVILRRSRKKVEEEAKVEDAPNDEEKVEEPDPAPQPALVRRKKVEEVVPEPQPEPEPEPEPTPEPVAEEPAEEEEPQEEAPVEDEVAAKPEEVAKTAEVVQPPTPESQRPAVVEAVPTAELEESRKGGAKVVGTINQTELMKRLEKDGKDFSPGPKRAARKPATQEKARGRAKRVVEGAELYDPKQRRKKRQQQQAAARKPKKTEITQAAEHKRVIRIEDAITVGDLAHQMGIKGGQVAMTLLELGMMANVNTTIDFETATIIAEEFGYTVENVAFDIAQFYDTTDDPEDSLQTRPPVVTVMGHVDHGKTSVLDAIRSSSVAEAEAGGITQHIGAYQVETDQGKITFLDTPGHEAFTALRARGAKATDIVVLVVAADDGVMPQTVEAINHAQDAGVPIIVAVNKIDKEAANVDRVKTALSEYELIPEDWGGTTLYVEVSALLRTNIDELVSTILLQAEVEDLRARPDRDAQGLVVEAELDIGRGPVATVLVQRGTLKNGDILVSGQFYGRVRTMTDWQGKVLDTASPSTPIEITGLGGVPEAGEPFFVTSDERDAKRITQNVVDQRRKEVMASRAKEAASSLEDLSAMIREGEIKEMKVVIKGDVQGSVEALKEAFGKLGNAEVAVKVIHAAVGGITENDVNLAASSERGAVIIGFNVRPDPRATEMAEKYDVKILQHSIIYDAIDQVRQILEGMLAPVVEETLLGRAEVRETFSAPKVGTIAGCYVQDGTIRRNARARLIREGRVVYESSISSLRRFKDDVREVKGGFECGLSLENFNDIKVGDIVEVFELKEVKATFDA